MKIYVLTDNHAQRQYAAEWGLSLYIECSTTLLFDFGNTDLFLKNAEKLGVDPLGAEHFVLSHGHWDHGNGLRYMPRRKLVCHPGVFINRYRGKNYLGLPFPENEMKEKFDFILTAEPFKLDESTFFLGEVPRRMDFESRSTDFIKEDGSMDLVMDDSGLAIKTEKGLVVITGCAHAGVCNTIEHAMDVCGDSRVYAVLGGFHLKGGDELTEKTIGYLKKKDIQYISTSHCTQFPALVQFANELNCTPYMSGEIIEL